ASHASASLARTFNDPDFLVSYRFPVTWPLEQIVAGLNETRPKVLFVYPSMVPLLVEAARSGHLRIDPVAVLVAAEPLLPEIRDAAEATWGAPVWNLWGATEIGALALPCPAGRIHLAEDFGIIELVDEAG